MLLLCFLDKHFFWLCPRKLFYFLKIDEPYKERSVSSQCVIVIADYSTR